MDAVTHLAPTVGIVAACDFLAVARASFYRQRPVLGPSASASCPSRLCHWSGHAPARSLSRGRARGGAAGLFMKSDSRTALRRPCRPLCWTKASTSARPAPCTASWNRRGNLASAAINSSIRLTISPSCWPPHPTNFGAGTSPSCWGPAKWTYFYLYVILDVFSRYVTGWMIAYREGAELAKEFIEEAIQQASDSRRPAHHPRRPRPGHEVQAGRLPDGRPGRHQEPQPTLCFR